MTKILKILILEDQNIDVRFNLSLDAGKAGLLDPKCEEGWDQKCVLESILNLDVGKAGLLDPKSEEGWDFGSKKWSFFGRLNDLNTIMNSPSWTTLGAVPAVPGSGVSDGGQTHFK